MAMRRYERGRVRVILENGWRFVAHRYSYAIVDCLWHVFNSMGLTLIRCGLLPSCIIFSSLRAFAVRSVCVMRNFQTIMVSNWFPFRWL
jgi:hypothetical protein